MAGSAMLAGAGVLPAETLEQARSGEEAALRRIYEAHAGTIFNRLWKLVGERERAEELCQDAFSVAFQRLDQLDGDKGLAAWLHGIAFNLARADNARRRRRRGLLSRFRARVEPSPLPPADAGVVQGEVAARLSRAMDVLSDEQREAYVMRVLEDLPLEECSRLMSVPVSTISYRARRAEELVRTRFEEEE